MSDEKAIRAGEYVLGTLGPAERAEAERQLRRDPEFATAVQVWERHLAPLAERVPEVEPPPEVWSRIAAATGPSAVPARAARRETGESLLDRLAFWRWTSLVTGAAAAGLAVALALSFAPRPSGEGRFIAALQSGGEAPPVMVTVDLAANALAVRSLAAEAPAERSYEVWYIGEGDAPQSLGVLDEVGAVINVALNDIPDFQTEGAIFAITVEPVGGSATGAPTGPIVLSGPLLQPAL
jgi:anti-sigma-K factor RskA